MYFLRSVVEKLVYLDFTEARKHSNKNGNDELLSISHREGKKCKHYILVDTRCFVLFLSSFESKY
jgi:hypothetical protein